MTGGTPWGFQLAVGSEFSNLERGHPAEGLFVALELDFSRLSVIETRVECSVVAESVPCRSSPGGRFAVALENHAGVLEVQGSGAYPQERIPLSASGRTIPLNVLAIRARPLPPFSMMTSSVTLPARRETFALPIVHRSTTLMASAEDAVEKAGTRR